jgi:alpha-L-fucosidase 2
MFSNKLASCRARKTRGLCRTTIGCLPRLQAKALACQPGRRDFASGHNQKLILLNYFKSLALAFVFSCVAFNSRGGAETTIWFDKPASDFTASCPVGNGPLGAMMFGGVDDERIVLNESSMWSGSRQDADRPDAYKALPEIRRLLLEGKNSEAEALVDANFTCVQPGSAGPLYGCYQVLGNLHLSFADAVSNEPPSGYRRELNLNDALAELTLARNGVVFQRELFASAPDGVIVLRLSADRAGKISFAARLDRPERFETVADGANGLLMTGQLDNGVDGKGVKYAARIRILNRGGKVVADGNTLRVSGADDAVLLIAAATDFQGFAGRQLKDPIAATSKDLRRAARKSFETLREAHISDYRKYFDRVHLDLESTSPNVGLPTPQRTIKLRQGAEDPGMAALYFNFGRYLLISSSRPGGLPANLQGIWAEETHTPWNGDWHLDVNVQMNYWPAEVCNLSDLNKPLFDLIDSLQEPGARTAHDYYDAGGWVAHVITNPWGFTSPGESASWGAFACGSAWLCQHLYDHYLFTGDRKYLKWAYPIMKGAARFYADMLIEDPKHHWLVFAPANSPENSFKNRDGKESSIALGATVYSQMIDYLFNACIESSKVLNVDGDFRNELSAKRANLAPTQIGPDGRIMEWHEPYAETEPTHRHVSHLWGLYPGDEISTISSPNLAAAAAKSLEVRGDEGTGWSRAYKAALWARLDDGNHAYQLLRNALTSVGTMEIRYDNGGGVYQNLFDACPPFQIDGNFGCTAAIAEMLLQSHDGVIQLLPALPDAWRDGSVTGLRARGGFEISLWWKDGALTRVALRSEKGGACHLSYRGKAVDVSVKPGFRKVLTSELTRPAGE